MSTSLDSANALATRADTKLAVNLSTAADLTIDRQVRRLINGVSHQFNAHTGRKLKKRTLTEYYDGDGTALLNLDQYPIRSNSTGISVHVIDERQTFASDTDFGSTYKVAAADIDIREDEGQLQLRDAVFTKGRANVKVVYEAGFETTASSTNSEHLPNDLQEAFFEQVHFLWSRSSSNRIGLRSKSTATESENYAIEALPFTVRTALDSHRDQRFA